MLGQEFFGKGLDWQLEQENNDIVTDHEIDHLSDIRKKIDHYAQQCDADKRYAIWIKAMISNTTLENQPNNG